MRVKLGNVFTLIRNGASIKQTDGASGIPITRIETISNREVDRNKFGYADIMDATKYEDYLLQDGDILMSHINSEKHLGKVALYKKRGSEQIIHGMNLLMLRANPSVLFPPFAIYFFETSAFLLQIKKITKKSVNQASFTVKSLKEVEIPLPPIDEQRKIAAVLDKVSDLIAKRKQQLDKLDELVKSRFIEMFGEPDENPMGWEVTELEHQLEIVGGFAFKSTGFTDSGIPVLRIGNINSGHFLPVNMVFWPNDPTLARYKMYPGDLVMSLTGTVGKDDYGNVCILSDEYPEYYLNQRNAKLVIKTTMNKHYLSELLKFSKIKKRLTGISRGVRQANISNRDILALCVPIPPIKLQEQFADFVAQTDKSKLAIQKSLEKLEILKKALMQKYFG